MASLTTEEPENIQNPHHLWPFSQICPTFLRMDQFCFCVDLREGSYAVAAISIIMALFDVFLCLAVIAGLYLEDISVGMYTGASVCLLFAFIFLTMSIVLLAGVHENVFPAVSTWMLFAIFYIVLEVLKVIAIMSLIIMEREQETKEGFLSWAIVDMAIYAFNGFFLIYMVLTLRSHALTACGI